MNIPNKRTLKEAVHKLVQSNDLDMADFEAVTAALAQVFTDETGVDCQVVIKVDFKQVHEVLKAKGI